jgi:hypothetical protein
MEKQIVLQRINRVEKLAAIARENKTINKCYQAYWLLERLNKRIYELSILKTI